MPKWADHGVKMLYFDEDSDARFYMPEAGTMTTDVLDGMLANLAQTKIGCLIVGVNAQRSNFRSRFVESYLDRFDAAGGLLQPAMQGSRDVWRFRRCANMAALEAQGVDSNAYLLSGARKLGRGAWIDVRMNDIHDGHDENSSVHAALWREHPELRIPGNIPCGNGYDYRHEKIRTMYENYIAEADEKYRPDNVLLDWMRWPAYFPKGTGRENAPLITDFLRKIRTRLGHPAACRVPIAPETALDVGLDVEAWVREGLISHLFVGNFCVAPDFDVPVERWKKIAGELPVVVTVDYLGLSGSRGFTTPCAGASSRRPGDRRPPPTGGAPTGSRSSITSGSCGATRRRNSSKRAWIPSPSGKISASDGCSSTNSTTPKCCTVCRARCGRGGTTPSSTSATTIGSTGSPAFSRNGAKPTPRPRGRFPARRPPCGSCGRPKSPRAERSSSPTRRGRSSSTAARSRALRPTASPRRGLWTA